MNKTSFPGYVIKWVQPYTEWVVDKEQMLEDKLNSSDFAEAIAVINYIRAL